MQRSAIPIVPNHGGTDAAPTKAQRQSDDLPDGIAVRCADPSYLRSVTLTRLDSRAFVARTSIPGCDDLGGFGASELGDLVSRLVGPAALDGLLVSEAGAASDIRGADAVNLPLA